MENTTMNNEVIENNAAVITENPVTVEPVNPALNAIDNAVQKSLLTLPNSAVKPDPLGIVILSFGVIGVGATGYGIYRLGKFIVDKVKASKEVKAEPVEKSAEKPVEEPAAEEKTE